MTIVADDNTATPGGGHAEDVMERALAAAIQDPGRIGDLLDELSRGRLWLPLPDDGRPVTDGSAVNLPTLTYLGTAFVPAFTSAARLRGSVPWPRTPDGAVYIPAPVQPHIVVPAAALARLLPADVGIALNPGAGESVPVYPEGVRYLASARDPDPRRRITVGPPPAPPEELLSGIRSGLAAVPAVRDAAVAWLSVEFAGEGLVISVTLDDPEDGPAQDAALRAIERAVLAEPRAPGFPIDVTFPGEGAPDPVDEWVSSSARPFYRRA
jgi:SseB protein N-terminal domain/SseB protein C-terminal domain